MDGLGVIAARRNYDEAANFFKQALKIRMEIYKDDKYHPDLAKSYRNLANVFSVLNQIGKAIQYYRKALDIWDKPNNEVVFIKERIDCINHLSSLHSRIGFSRVAKDFEQRSQTLKTLIFQYSTCQQTSNQGNLRECRKNENKKLR